VPELIATDAGRFRAEVAGPASGAAPLVVLLHGFPQSRHSWRAQVPALGEAGYRAVAPDQRGYSPQARPDPAEVANYGIDLLVADVLGLAEALGRGPDQPFHLVGHDWGGAVAWMVAARHPDRLASLTVLSRPHPGAFRRAFRADADGQRHRSRHHQAFLEPETGPRLLADDARRLRANLAEQGVGPASVDEYLSVLGEPAAMEAALGWYRAAAGDLSAMEAAPVPVPTLYLWGDGDATVSKAAARGTADFVTGPYQLEVLAGAGHFLTDERPDDVTRLLLAHLGRWVG
jgi:pimeloyl-ACP methyl ester carboxylesterase